MANSPQPISARMGAAEWAILTLLAVLWGGAFFFIEVALAGVPPITLVLVRMTLAALLLYVAMRLMGQRLPGGWRVWRALFLLGLLNNALPFMLYAWGQMAITGGLASILNATTPLWAVVVAHLLTDDEKATPGKVAGVLLGIVGVVVMVGGDALAGLGDALVAQIACLVGALSYALASVQARGFRAMGVRPMALATGQSITAAALLLPVALIVETPWRLPMPGVSVVAALLGLAIFSTTFAYVLYFRLLETAGATNSLLVTFLIPITAILLGTLVLGERVEPGQLIGMALIALGLAAIDGRPWAWLTRRRQPLAPPPPRP
ncbi:DMT family transporter [Sphingomonas sp. SCN 67-18]|uniref:DMT family transporter n=1 Tax=uncultured Sphingomonas sp. TaxID=158754 RepID=UPI0025D21B88|nr:DMT family transporter [Sphingomonas sp. SCN 67-18]